MMDGITLRYELKAGTTTVNVDGSIEVQHCETLRDGLDFARALRTTGPIVVDLAGVDQLALAALVILYRAADDARRAGREVSVRNLRQEHITDPRSVGLLRNDASFRTAAATPTSARR
jgi:anti-anti-sigma regulatory factor